jgi:hypothetical protein
MEESFGAGQDAYANLIKSPLALPIRLWSVCLLRALLRLFDRGGCSCGSGIFGGGLEENTTDYGNVLLDPRGRQRRDDCLRVSEEGTSEVTWTVFDFVSKSNRIEP